VARKRIQISGKHIPRRRQTTRSEQAKPSSDFGWIYGQHACMAAVANPRRKIHRLVATREVGASFANIHADITVEIIKRSEIELLLPSGAVHQGVALLASPLPVVTVADIIERAKKNERILVVALDQVTDPQNVGAIIRSASALGADALLVPDRHTPEISGALTKAASGAVEKIPIIRPSNLVRALETLKSAGLWVVGLDVEAPNSLSEVDLPGKCILAVGAEGKGLRRLTSETCDLRAHIPMIGDIQSLNVSAGAAIALYEWSKQKGTKY